MIAAIETAIIISTHTLTWSVTNISATCTSCYVISTHTLTWSVTGKRWRYRRCLAFQLTRSRGAWHGWTNNNSRNKNFNSHAHVERDDMQQKNFCLNYSISTHTLTWSVTRNTHGRTQNHQFQLTRSRGAWRYIHMTEQDYSLFQLTRSRGAWRQIQTGLHRTDNFNSHAHVERDRVEISIYTAIWYFNSHAHVERDFFTADPFAFHVNFNSHAHVERDVYFIALAL